MATKTQAGGKGAQTAKGDEAGRRLKAEAKKEENKVEARKGSDLKKGAARVEERSKSSDGKSAGEKQGVSDKAVMSREDRNPDIKKGEQTEKKGGRQDNMPAGSEPKNRSTGSK